MHDRMKEVQAIKMMDEGINFVNRNALAFKRDCLGVSLSDDQNVFADMGFQQMLDPLNSAKFFLNKAGVNFEDGAAAQSLLHRALTTSDMVDVIRDATDDLIIEAYHQAPSTFRAWSIPHVVKDMGAVALAGAAFSGMKPVGEGAEYPEAKFRHAYNTGRLKTFGGRFAISYEAYLDAHFGLIRDSARLMGRAAAMKANIVAYEVLLSNPKLSDGEVLFSEDRGTLVTPSTLNAATLSKAAAALRSHVDPAGNTLNLSPAYLLAPPALEAEARILCRTVNDVATPFEPHLFPVIEPLIGADAGGSDTTWYLCARPEDGSAFAQLALTPRAEPTIRTNASFTTDTIEWKLRMETNFVVKSGIGMIRVDAE